MKGLMLAVLVVAGGCGEATAVTSEGDEGFVEPDTGELVVDGDVLDVGGEWAETEGGLTVSQVDGHDDVWSRTARKKLTYCIDERSFGAATDVLRAALQAAIADWEAPANVHFSEVDVASCTRSTRGVVFDVRAVSGRPYLARSFFPSTARSSRELLVDATSLPPPPPLTLAGVLRHELGHVLGLRHEHTRQVSNPCFEDANWRAVTPYDVRSVMHYPQCRGLTDRDLVLSAKDRAGIGTLYP